MLKINDPCKTVRTTLYLSLISTILVAIVLVIVILSPGGNGMNLDSTKSYATKLVNSELYEQAILEYEGILANYRLSQQEAGSILYQIGSISGEKLHDPAKAVASFMKIKELYPGHPLSEQINKELIAQLDKMGKSRQAQNLLKKSVSLGQSALDVVDPSIIVAKIGDKVITIDEVEKALEALPREVSEQLSNPTARGYFLRDFVGQKLLYNAAIRAGYDRKAKILGQFDSAKENIIVSAYYKDNIADRVKISASDIEVHYNMNKSDFGDKPLDEVRQQVEQNLQYQKMSELQEQLFDELMKTENVQLFPENMNKLEE